MCWQLLGFSENSLRKQLWIPSSLLPLATGGALDTVLSPGPQAVGSAPLGRAARLAFIVRGCSGNSRGSRGCSPTQRSVGVSWGRPAPPQLGPCGSLLRADARRGSYGQCLAPELQTNLQGAKRAGNSPGDSVGRIRRPCRPPTGEGPPPFVEKGHRASPERCAVNNLGKKHSAC